VLVSDPADSTLAVHVRCAFEPVGSEALATHLRCDVEAAALQILVAEPVLSHPSFHFDAASRWSDCPLFHLWFACRLHSAKCHLLNWRPSLRKALSAVAAAALPHLCLLLGALAALLAQLHEPQPAAQLLWPPALLPAEQLFVRLALLPPVRLSEPRPSNQHNGCAAVSPPRIDEASQELVDRNRCRGTYKFVHATQGFGQQQVHPDADLFLWNPGTHVPGTVAASWAATDGGTAAKRALAEVPAALHSVSTELFGFAQHFELAARNAGLQI